MYPNASEKEWKTKNNEERLLNVCRLRNPEFDVNVDESDDNDDEKQFLAQCNTVLEQPLLYQAYEFIRQSKGAGVSEPELGAHFGLGKISRRAVIKQLRKHLEFYVTSSGRQKMRK